MAHTNGAAIEAHALTKRYGSATVVDNLSFEVLPGSVTGFLGPNGSGKSTTMRMVMGLDQPTAGTATIAGRPYAQHTRPLFTVGALIEARAVHEKRSAFNHLLCLAQSNGIRQRRVAEVLELVGLTTVAKKPAAGFSLGMGQRLGIAAALLGNPRVLLFDEPVNGLDPEGIVWVRTLMRSLAAEGRAVLVSSHLMSEMALTADQLIVIGRGKLIASMSVDDFVAQSSHNFVRVRTPEPAKLLGLLGSATSVSTDDDGAMRVVGLDCAAIGDLANAHDIALHELAPQLASLEDAFMEVTRDSVEYHADDRPSGASAGSTAWR